MHSSLSFLIGEMVNGARNDKNESVLKVFAVVAVILFIAMPFFLPH